MRRFNARTLMYRTKPMFPGRQRCSSAQKLQWKRMLMERLGTWREPMSRKRSSGVRKVWRMYRPGISARGVEIDQSEHA